MNNAGSASRAARQQTLFSYFDVNRDGVIDVSDFVAITQRASSFLPVGAAPSEEVLHAARVRFSWFRKADSDADRRVTAEEWMAHCAKEFAGNGLSDEAEAFARAFFRTLDIDQDAAIDFGDYAYAHLAYGRDPTVEALYAGFRALDANGSGKVTLPEFLTAYERFVASDAEDVGGLLVG